MIFKHFYISSPGEFLTDNYFDINEIIEMKLNYPYSEWYNSSPATSTEGVLNEIKDSPV